MVPVKPLFPQVGYDGTGAQAEREQRSNCT